MNYLKKFESFQTNDEIHEICEMYDITNYTINPDVSIDVNGDVDLTRKRLEKLPLKFNQVSGDFICHSNFLTTLEGAPKSVNGNFDCYKNHLTTLEDAPNTVNGYFDCSVNRLTTLKGAPYFVNVIFQCNFNKDLKSLKYLPKRIESDVVDFKYTQVYEIFKLLDNYSLGMVRIVNDLKVVVDDKVNIEILNDLLYDQGKPPVEKVKGYDNL